MADRMVVGFDLLQRALRAQQLDDLGPRFCHGQAVQLQHLGDVHPAIQMENCQDRKMMSLADVVIGDIMARGHLDRPGPKLAIDGLIGHDRHDAMDHRQRHRLADQVLVTPVVGVDRDTGVTDHGLRTSRRDRDEAAAFDRVVEVVELIVRLFVLNFQVRDGALVPRAPVDDPRTPVDEALSPELDEGVPDRIHVGRVHGEPDARPIRRETKPAHLLEDGVPGGLVPVLHQSIPGVPADRFFRRAFLGQLLFEDILGGDRGVVRPGHPERRIAQHAVPADEHVLQRVHGVTHMQIAGDVGWRHGYGEGLTGQTLARLEITALLPGVIPALLDGFRVIAGLHRGHLVYGPSGLQAAGLSRARASE